MSHIKIKHKDIHPNKFIDTTHENKWSLRN